MTTEQNPEDEVWGREEAYWGYARVADVEGFLSLWHEDGIAWYSSQALPADKEGFRQHVAQAFASLQSESLGFEPRRLSVRIYGNTAVTYFELHTGAVTKGGAEFIEQERATHSWLHTDNGWKLISGMQAPLMKILDI